MGNIFYTQSKEFYLELTPSTLTYDQNKYFGQRGSRYTNPSNVFNTDISTSPSSNTGNTNSTSKPSPSPSPYRNTSSTFYLRFAFADRCDSTRPTYPTHWCRYHNAYRHTQRCHGQLCRSWIW